MTRGPGLYLNLFKFVPVVLIYLLWAMNDRLGGARHQGTQQPEVRRSGTASMFFSGVLGLVLVLAIPVYFLGLGLLLLAYFIPLLSMSTSATRRSPTIRRC